MKELIYTALIRLSDQTVGEGWARAGGDGIV